MPMQIVDSWFRTPRARYRNLAVFGMAAALGGCMTLGENTPPAPTAPPPVADVTPSTPLLAVVPMPRPKRAAHEAKPEFHAAHDKLPLVEPDKLIGMEPDRVQKLLGTPVRVQNNDMSREWVYAAPGCFFRVFFYPNLNAASFRVLKYGGTGNNGELLDVSDVCVRRILMAKSNAAN